MTRLVLDATPSTMLCSPSLLKFNYHNYAIVKVSNNVAGLALIEHIIYDQIYLLFIASAALCSSLSLSLSIENGVYTRLINELYDRFKGSVIFTRRGRHRLSP